MSVIGQNSVRIDGIAKASGDAVYTVDYSEPGMLYGKLLRSPVAAGVIKTLDVSKARSMPGVKAIVTKADVPMTRTGMLIKDHTIFADDRVRYIGEPIAAIAAETQAQADAAIETIPLQIEEHPALSDMQASLSGNAPLIHPELKSYERILPFADKDIGSHDNVASEVIVDTGGIDEIFAKAFLVVEDELEGDRQYQAYLETKAAVASYRDGRYIIHTGNQWPFAVRDEVAEMLDVKPSSVQLINHTVGGAFGAKLETALEPYAAVLAKVSGRPVKMVNTRTEDMLTSNARENGHVRIRSAVDKDGNILAREFIVLHDCGAYSSETPIFPSVSVHVAQGAYRVGALRVIARSVYTNTAPTGAYRGVCATYLYAAIEQHMDHIAKELGVDRREYRLRHIMKAGDTLHNGQSHPDADILQEEFDAIEKIAPWEQLTADAKPYRGVAISPSYWMNSVVPGAASVRLCEDGTIRLLTAANENGSGAVAMALTQIVAEGLGVSTDDVFIPTVDTDACAYEGGSQGSRTTPITGEACRRAADELRGKIINMASDMLEANPDDLELVDGTVGVVGSNETRIPLSAVAGTATFLKGIELSGTGSYIGPQPELKNPMGCVASIMAPGMTIPNYHVHLAEVDVDPVTGNVRVVRYIVAQDVGKLINPAGAYGQVQGAVAQGLGYTLYENMRLEDCRPRECTFEAYRLPLSVDIPRVETIFIERPSKTGPYGAKGVAEPPILLCAAVIANAVADAIGKKEPFTQIPITPEVVLAAIKEQEETQG